MAALEHQVDYPENRDEPFNPHYLAQLAQQFLGEHEQPMPAAWSDPDFSKEHRDGNSHQPQSNGRKNPRLVLDEMVDYLDKYPSSKNLRLRALLTPCSLAVSQNNWSAAQKFMKNFLSQLNY